MSKILPSDAALEDSPSRVFDETEGDNIRPWWVPPRMIENEWIDSFDHSTDEFCKSFRDIERLNRWFGGVSVVLRHFADFLNDKCMQISVLDVCTGGGDIPRELIQWGSERDVRISVCGLDANPKAIEVAKSAPPIEGLQYTAGDALDLPFESESFDVVLCSLALHHFEAPDARTILREMMRVSRKGIIVNDLRRAYLPAALIWAITRLLGMSRLARHDAPLSVLRSRTASEYRNLAESCGLADMTIHKHAFWRVALVGRKA